MEMSSLLLIFLSSWLICEVLFESDKGFMNHWEKKKKNTQFEQNIQSQMITNSHRLISCLSTLCNRECMRRAYFLPWYNKSIMFRSAKKRDHASEI